MDTPRSVGAERLEQPVDESPTVAASLRDGQQVDVQVGGEVADERLVGPRRVVDQLAGDPVSGRRRVAEG